MPSLTTALITAGQAMDITEQAIGVIQNNVSNASTPGYVTQTLDTAATSFDPAQNLWGGVTATGTESARNSAAEQAVWNQNELLGNSTAQASSLSALQNNFNVSGQSGIPAALSGLYAAFSAWSQSPSDAAGEQQVLAAAQNVAQAFNQTATGIEQVASQATQSLQSTVTQINQLSSEIAAINGQIRTGSAHDAGLNAQLYNTLEQLSNLTNISVLTQTDGTVTVLMNGQTPLVIGQSATQLQVSFVTPPGAVNPNAPPDAAITTATGQDVTGSVSGGQLAGYLSFYNTALPSVIGDGQQQGSLNQLAQAVADTVNTLLTSGQTSGGAPGVPLFTYTSGSPTSVAQTLAVSPSITPSALAPVQPGPPSVANGIADQLAQLANPQGPTGKINGMSFTDFYAGIASGIGSQAATASSNQQTQTDLLTQAQNMRAQVSGVSLNDQATQLLQFQQGYEASAQMISLIEQTMNYFMTAMQQTS